MIKTFLISLFTNVLGIVFLITIANKESSWVYDIGSLLTLTVAISTLSSVGFTSYIFRKGFPDSKKLFRRYLISISFYKLLFTTIVGLVLYKFGIISIHGFIYLLIFICFENFSFALKSFNQMNFLQISTFIIVNVPKLLVLSGFITTVDLYILFLALGYLVIIVSSFLIIKPIFILVKPRFNTTYLRDAYFNYILREYDNLIALIISPTFYESYYIFRKFYIVMRQTLSLVIEKLAINKNKYEINMKLVYDKYLVIFCFSSFILLFPLIYFSINFVYKIYLTKYSPDPLNLIIISLCMVSLFVHKPIYSWLNFGGNVMLYKKNITTYFLSTLLSFSILIILKPDYMILGFLISNIISFIISINLYRKYEL